MYAINRFVPGAEFNDIAVGGGGGN